MNELTTRTKDVIAAEINDICGHARKYALLCSAEIGRRLCEAKDMLSHGEWGNWLKENFEFSERTAQNHMKIFKAYGSTQFSLFGAELKTEVYADLSVSQALKLLAIPEEEREDFVEENNVATLTAKEIDELIAERNQLVEDSKKLRKNVENLTNQNDTLRSSNASLTDAYNNAKARVEKTQKDFEAYKQKPDLDDATLANLTATAVDAAVADREREISVLENQIDQLRKERDTALTRNESLKKQTSNEIVEFKTLFRVLQKTYAELYEIANSVDIETNVKLLSILKKWIDSVGGVI